MGSSNVDPTRHVYDISTRTSWQDVRVGRTKDLGMDGVLGQVDLGAANPSLAHLVIRPS